MCLAKRSVPHCAWKINASVRTIMAVKIKLCNTVCIGFERDWFRSICARFFLFPPCKTTHQSARARARVWWENMIFFDALQIRKPDPTPVTWRNRRRCETSGQCDVAYESNTPGNKRNTGGNGERGLYRNTERYVTAAMPTGRY